MGTRHERVVLDLEDNLTPGALRAAAAVGVLDKSLNGLNDRNVAVARSVQTAAPQIERVGTSARKSAADIDSMSGRVSILADVLLALGPAAIPIGAVAIPALTTLAGAGAAAAVGAGSMAIAFQGVGDALGAMNEAHLEPTKENLEEARVAMERLAPAAQEFVKQIDSMRGLGAGIRDAGAQALFPGLTEALETIESRGPEVTRIVEAFNRKLGDIASDAATSLASDRWDDFFRMVEREGPRTLDPLARAIGDVAHGASEIMEAFAPLNRDGMGWIEGAADGFDKWATGLKNTDGFKSFVAYVRENGPQVAETVGALANALAQIAEAAAPLGGPALTAIEGIANAAAGIAGSGFGTELLAAATAFRLMSRFGPGATAALAVIPGAGGGKPGKPGKTSPDTSTSRRPRGGGPGTLAATMIVPGLLDEFLTKELGWEKAGPKQIAAGEQFVEEWGHHMVDQAERVRVRLSKVLKVDTGQGPFGFFANDEGLGKALLDMPYDKALNLQQRFVKRFGLNFRQLEKHGILPEDFTRQFREGRDDIDAFANDIRRLNRVKGEPKVGLRDEEAKRKERVQDDWIMSWGRKNARAKAELDDKQAQARGRAVEGMLNGIDRKRARPTADLNDQASGPLNNVLGLLGRADGYHANSTITTTYVTRRVNEGNAGGFTNLGAQSMTGSADGGTVPRSGRPYADRYPYLLADGEEVISNRHGQADRHRALLKAINAGRLANGGTAGRGVSPSVSVGGAQVRVFIDGSEVRAIVRQEQNAQSRWEREQGQR